MERLRLLWVTPDLPVRGVSAARSTGGSCSPGSPPATRSRCSPSSIPRRPTPSGALPAGLADAHLWPKRRYTPDDPVALLPQTVAGGFADPGLREAIATRLARGRLRPRAVRVRRDGEPDPAVDRARHPDRAPDRLRRAGPALARRGRTAAPRRRPPASLSPRARLRAPRRCRARTTSSPCRRRTPHACAASCPIFASPSAPSASTRATVQSPACRARSMRSQLLFVGHFVHPPNGDAVRFLATRRPAAARPGVRLRVVGHGARGHRRARARRGDRRGRRRAPVAGRRARGRRAGALRDRDARQGARGARHGASGRHDVARGRGPGRESRPPPPRRGRRGRLRRRRPPRARDAELAARLGARARARRGALRLGAGRGRPRRDLRPVRRAARDGGAADRRAGASRFPRSPGCAAGRPSLPGACDLPGGALSWHAQRLLRRRATSAASAAPAERPVPLPG